MHGTYSVVLKLCSFGGGSVPAGVMSIVISLMRDRVHSSHSYMKRSLVVDCKAPGKLQLLGKCYKH